MNGEITKINSETRVQKYTMYTDATKNSKDVYNFTNATYVDDAVLTAQPLIWHTPPAPIRWRTAA